MTFHLTLPSLRRCLPVCLSLLTVTACSTEADRELDKERDAKRKLEIRTAHLEQAHLDATAKDSELTQLTQTQDQTIKDLESSLALAKDEHKKTLGELDSAQSSLQQKSQRVSQLSSELETKQQLIARINASLKHRDLRIKGFEAIALNNAKTIKELEAKLAAMPVGELSDLQKILKEKIEESQRVGEEILTVRKEKDELTVKLGQSEAELGALRQEKDQLNGELIVANLKGVQTLLENLGPETLFSPTSFTFRDSYKLADKQDCVFIFNMDRKLEVVSKQDLDSIPNMNSIDLLPIRLGYTKVAVCQTGDVTQAHKETGHVYKVNPKGETNKDLITSREDGSCDSSSEEVKKASIFFTPNQYFTPYRGPIDGFETIEMTRPNSTKLEFNMGSGNADVRASSCEEVLEEKLSSPLVTLACRLALGEKAEDLKVEMGCFTEKSVGTLSEIIFNK